MSVVYNWDEEEESKSPIAATVSGSVVYSWADEEDAPTVGGGVSTTYSWSDEEDAATAGGVSTTYSGDGSSNIDHDAAVSGRGVETRESE